MPEIVKAKRGRPKQAGLADKRRQQIIESAFQVFANLGYDGTTIALLASHAGVGQGTVYRYFTNKREILDHVFDFSVQKLFEAVDVAEITEPSESLDDFAAKMRLVGANLFLMFHESPQLLKLVLVDGAATDDELTLRVRGLHHVVATTLATALDEGKDKGWVRTDVDSQIFSEAAIALILPGVLRGLQGEFKPEAETLYAAKIVDILIRGLGVR